MNIKVTKQQLIELQEKLNPLIKKALVGKPIKPVTHFGQGLVPMGEETIVESPDKVLNSYDDLIAHWSNDDAIAFGFLNNRAFIGYNNELFFESNNIKQEKKDFVDRMNYKLVEKMMAHAGMSTFYKILYGDNGIGSARSLFDYPGRVWINKKIISFWQYPDKTKLFQLTKLLTNEIEKIYGIKIDFSSYRIEIKNNEYQADLDAEDEDYEPDYEWETNKKIGNLIPIKDFISSNDATEQEMQNIHTMPSDEKRNTPQMQAARDLDAERLGSKFNGNVSQAEWNSAKKKYQGESKTFKITTSQLNEIKKHLNEEFDSTACPFIEISNELSNYISKFNTDEKFLRSGGLPVNMLDRIAFGFADEDIKTLNPKQLNIKWKDDLNNVIWEIKRSGLSQKEWAYKVDLTEPIDVSYEKNKFYIEDGHHRYCAAKILDKDLNVNIEINMNPTEKIAPGLGYDNLCRCLFKQIKDEGANPKNEGVNIEEDIKLPVNVGDTVLMGKFKNKKTVVKKLDKDSHGMPTINGKQAATFRTADKKEKIEEEISFIEKEINIEDILLTNNDGQSLEDAFYDIEMGFGSKSEGKILVKQIGEKYTISDGFHRVAEAILRGENTILVDVVQDNINEATESDVNNNNFSPFTFFKDNETGMPFYDNIINGKSNDNQIGFDIIIMSPNAYFKNILLANNAPNYGVEKYLEGGVNKNKIPTIMNGMNSGVKYDIPVVDFRDGFQEGRHRALAARNLGVTEIPVAVFYNMENKPNILTEATESDVNLTSFKPKKQLNEKFWLTPNKNNSLIKPIIRKRLLKIADDFVDFLKIDIKKIEDVLFLGSLANYNWSTYSDIDLHLLVDMNRINKDLELVKDYFDAKVKVWQETHGELKICGFPVEIYVQDKSEENASVGVYSLEKNKWLNKPIEIDDADFNKKLIKEKAAKLMTEIEDVLKRYKSKPDFNELSKISNKSKLIYDKIKRLRKTGLASEDGETSVGNIVFKVLRRNGYLEKLVDLKAVTYDKINSLK